MPRRCAALVLFGLVCLPVSGACAQTPAAPTPSPSAEAAKPPISAAVKTWRDAVMARLVKFKPAGAGATGVAVVAFTLGADGQVLSATLAHPSGHVKLDEAAVAMVRRASPLPAPPAELSAPVSLTVPIRYR